MLLDNIFFLLLLLNIIIISSRHKKPSTKNPLAMGSIPYLSWFTAASIYLLQEDVHSLTKLPSSDICVTQLVLSFIFALNESLSQEAGFESRSGQKFSALSTT